MLVSTPNHLHKDFNRTWDQLKPIARELALIVTGCIVFSYRGVTFLDGEGGYSQRPKRVILTVTTMTEVPKIKEMIFAFDPKAFVVINNTFEVLGQRYGALKTY